jgi:hypothetical protein
LKLLEEELTGVWHLYAAHVVVLLDFLGFWLRSRAKVHVFETCVEFIVITTSVAVNTNSFVTNEATLVADINKELIRRNHEPFHDKIGCSIAYEAITFHLTNAKTTISRSTFRWLTSKGSVPTSGTGMHFVLYHMLESLVIDWSLEDKALQHLPSDTRHQQVLSVEAETMLN